MCTAIAEKHDAIAEVALEGVFNGISKDAPWQE